ncbi:MAG TPA: NAD(P)H-hydrate dehydratase [Verrucomicrobiae bacterium]|nr:NAD(P)H-hydrate dehydratase [Verrucomicrobiae bacterium]
MPKIPVISVEQMRQWEQATWAAGKTEQEVIQQVGRLLAHRILQLTHPADAIWILAGKGHNGDDARAAQPHLTERNVLLTSIDDPRQGLAEFTQRLHTQGLRRVRWIVDALFGIGLNRALNDDWCKLIEAMNASGIPILAVDVPSGLNADTGGTEGAAIKAALTLTLGAPKRGLLEAPAYTGRLEVVPEIGLVPCPIQADLNWTMPEDFAGLPPRRASIGNKGDYGHVAIVAGSLGYHGAAVLTAQGAQRAQPGLVTVFPQASVYVPVAAQLQAAMVHPWRAGTPLPKTCSVILFGPGLAAEELPDALKEDLRSLWRTSPLAMVVDASALDWLEPGPTPDGAVRVITPHPGEAGRLLRTSAKEVQARRVAALRALSKQFSNCCVVLKGHQTLVGRADGDIFVNSSGNPHLAQGGSGDLLGGYLAGLLAQPFWRQDPLLAARYAVWQHGAAADHLEETQVNWTVEDLAQWLGRIRT